MKRKAIIAGGRAYNVGPRQRRWLDGVNAVFDIEEVVSGGAPGADRGGEQWASSRCIPVQKFQADWNKHGLAAGPLRNRQMALYCENPNPKGRANLCILFPGGKGTASMKAEAKIHGLKVIEYKDLES